MSLAPIDRASSGPRTGLYVGFARLVAVGEQQPVDQALVQAVQVEVFIGGTTGTVRILDSSGLLSPDGELVGELTLNGSSGSIEWPRFSVVSGIPASGAAATEVVASATLSPVLFTGSAPSLAFPLDLEFVGVSDRSDPSDRRHPRASWRFVLARQADLQSTDVPLPPAPVALPQEGRGEAASAWEQAFAATFAPGGVAEVSDVGGALREADEGPLDVCHPQPIDRLATAAARAYFDQFRSNVSTSELIASSNAGLAAIGDAIERRDGEVTSIEVELSILDLGALEGVIPCQLALRHNEIGSRAQGLEIGNFDGCDEIAARFDCVPERRPGDETVQMRLNVSVEGGRPAVDINFEAKVERACLPGPDWGASGCAQMALCYEAPNEGEGSDRSSTFAPLLSSGDDGAGDLSCRSGTRSMGFVEARRTGRMFDVLTACLDDLDAFRRGPAPTPTSVHGEGLRTVLGTQGCLDPARFAFALGQSARAARTEGDHGEPARRESLAIGQRLLARWLQTHAFVARETAELERARGLLQLERPLPPRAALAASLAGWQLILHPRFYPLIEAAPGELLYAPDYRDVLFPDSAHPASEAEVGLAPIMIETLQAQAELLSRLLERAHRQPDFEVERALGEFLRVQTIVRSIAATIVERASLSSVEPPTWLERYETSLRAYGNTLTQILEQEQAQREGRNPLGIEAEDLPLYFFGDESSAASQFNAISDFLLGTRPGASVAWVPSSIASAADALDSARAAGLAQQDRVFSRALSDAELDDRLDDIRRSFGGEVRSYCGAPVGIDTLDILEAWPRFSANDCFVRKAETGCQIDEGAYEEAMALDDVRYQFCVVRELRAATGAGIGFLAPGYDEAAAALDDCEQITYAECPDGARGPCITCDFFEDDFLRYGLLTLQSSIAPTLGALCQTELLPACRSIPASADIFSAVHGLSKAPPELLADAERTCQTKYPDARTRLPSADELPDRPLRDRSCFDGSIGELALTLDAVAQEVDIARSEMAELQDAYDIAIRSCIIQQRGNDLLEATQDAHNRTMSSLRTQKATADQVAASAAAAKDCASAAAGATTPWQGAAAGVACATAGVEAGASLYGLELERQMEDAEANHAAVMMMIESQIGEEVCFNDAELHLVGVRTASLRVQRAAQDINLALYRFEQAKSSAQVAYDAGRAALTIARNRSLSPVGHDFWFSETVDLFTERMAIARRLTYLAVRAVEYEFQQSLGLGVDALAADLPSELEMVTRELQSLAATRGINGSRPADLKVVLSLRRDLLQLSDLSRQPDGFQQLSEVERFRMLLNSPRFAAYDDSGQYRGQRIPFDLAPLGALGLGQASEIPLLTAGDCAERLWSVNASVVGESLYRGNAPTFTRIELLKSNTFYSQWCADNPDERFQIASVRPTRNLFREPRYGSSLGDGIGGSAEDSLFTRARIEAYFNVPREELESDSFSSGSTSELAARGLYGRYALFIPAQVLSRDAEEAGLVLDQVDDILLRLDYVSVAR